MKTRYLVPAVLLIVLLRVDLSRAQVAHNTGKTVWDGIYTAEQATRGATSYKERCSRCHGETLAGTGGNGLVGKDFMERWREDSMGSLWEFVSESMPPARRGQGRPLISVPTYLDILAFVLSQNQFPAGSKPLSEEGLDEIMIEYKDGPRPLPNGALVRVAGCLAGSGQDWKLTGANEPVRTRTSQTSDYGEFKASQDAPAGSLTFGLFNLGILSNTFKPEDHAGEKLLVKGNLIRQPESMRVTVLAIRKIADHCP